MEESSAPIELTNKEIAYNLLGGLLFIFESLGRDAIKEQIILAHDLLGKVDKNARDIRN